MGQEIWGLVSFASGLLIFASLVSYGPEDPSFNSVSTSTNVNNLAGLFGSHLSDILFTLVGGAAYLVPFVLFLVGWKKFKIKEEDASNTTRIIGFCLLFLSLPTFLHLHLDRISLSIKGGIPAGGLIGDVIASMLTGCCATFGAHVITFTLVVISAVLAIGFSPADVTSSLWVRLKQWIQVLKNSVSRKGKEKNLLGEEGLPLLMKRLNMKHRCRRSRSLTFFEQSQLFSNRPVTTGLLLMTKCFSRSTLNSVILFQTGHISSRLCLY